ncbi:hypothetical protein ACWFRB_08995 [Rhodococcus sp. NPDC055112]
MNDDRSVLTRMGRHNPFPPNAHLAPPDGQLEEILAQTQDDVPLGPQSRSLRRSPLFVAASIVVAAGLVAGVATILVNERPADGVTSPSGASFSLPPTDSEEMVFSPPIGHPGDVPTAPMLEFVAYSKPVSSKDLLEHLANKAEDQPPSRGEGRYEYRKTRGWYLSSDRTTEGGVISSEIAEIDREQWTAEDGSGRIADTEKGETRSSDVGPSDFPWSRLDSGGLSVESLRARLLSEGSSRVAAQWFAAFTDSWSSQIVSPGLQSAFLRVLADQDDIEVLGAVDDREGRPGVAISTTTADKRLVIVFDETTGALLDYEQIALKPAAASVSIPLPSTVSYTVWLDAAYVDSTG